MTSIPTKDDSRFVREFARFIATWHYSGLSPKAPGTVGSIAALVPGVVLMAYSSVWVLSVAALLACLIGWWASAAYARHTGGKDPSEVVIDEVAGMWIALIPCGLVWWEILVAFALFRLFDIAKPGPVGWADKKLTGGLGIMADDIIAGLLVAGLIFAFKLGTGL